MIVFPTEDINPTRTRPYVTYVLMAVNAGVFLALGFLPDYPRLVAEYAFIPSDPTWIGALRSLFMHADVGHLLVDLVFLAIVADNVEDNLGHVGFLAFYLATGLFAQYAQMLTVAADLASTPVMAPSGAVSAVLGSYATMFPHSRIVFKGFIWLAYYFRPLRFTVPSLWAVIFWFVLQTILQVARYGDGGLDPISLALSFVSGVVVTLLLGLLGPVQLQWQAPDYLSPEALAAAPRPPGGADCPGCLVEMEEADAFGVVVDICRKCGGLWLDKGELDQLVQVEKLPKALLDPPAASQARVVLHEGERTCPRCHGPFELREYHGTTVEYCKPCGGMWLEKGELGQLLKR